jgi:hypothetical protein
MATEDQTRGVLEMTSWGLMAVATVGSAWCAYQASIWNGEQIRGLTRASVAQFASSREMSIVNRDVMIDVGTFINYVGADLRGDRRVADFLRAHARPDFKPALEAWIADEARTDAPNPFSRPEYRVVERKKVAELDEQALVDVARANAANENSDSYVLHTVLFALSLFFLGGTSEGRRQRLRRAMLALGAVVFALTVVSMVRLPRAHHPKLSRVESRGPSPRGYARRRFDLLLPSRLSATAARMSAFKAASSIFSPSWRSMARRTFPSRLELKSFEGSFNEAPLANVSFTTLLYVSPVQTMPPWEKMGVPIHFHSSTISGSASWMSLRAFASVFPRQSPSSSILASINAEADSTATGFFMAAPI